jgi:ABC-type antimicrobial peptide transport system permease subunit
VWTRGTCWVLSGSCSSTAGWGFRLDGDASTVADRAEVVPPRVVRCADILPNRYSLTEDAFAVTTLQHRSTTILLVLFASLAAVLAALGVYAVMAQSVAARRQEIGVRMALGAASADVVRLIAGQALRLLLIGSALGLAGGIALGRVASSLLVGTSPSDPTVLGAVTALLVTTGLAAGWLPARKASRIDPASALRSE